MVPYESMKKKWTKESKNIWSMSCRQNFRGMLKEKPMKVEDEAKDDDEVEVEAMDEDVVAEEREMRKIILKKEEIKIFHEVIEEKE